MGWNSEDANSQKVWETEISLCNYFYKLAENFSWAKVHFLADNGFIQIVKTFWKILLSCPSLVSVAFGVFCWTILVKFKRSVINNETVDRLLIIELIKTKRCLILTIYSTASSHTPLELRPTLVFQLAASPWKRVGREAIRTHSCWVCCRLWVIVVYAVCMSTGEWRRHHVWLLQG